MQSTSDSFSPSPLHTSKFKPPNSNPQNIPLYLGFHYLTHNQILRTDHQNKMSSQKLLPTSTIHTHSTTSPAVIHVRNLQTTLPIATDAWGRKGKLQPVLISCSVYLREGFVEASERDEVTGGSTVHYGSLSKGILAGCEGFKTGASLRKTVQGIRESLVGQEGNSLLTSKILNVLTITITLPKASLLGTGISLTQSTTYEASSPGFTGVSYALRLHDLKIPTLIGVNANERLAKQMVVANIEIDRWQKPEDCYVELERIVVSVCSLFLLPFSSHHPNISNPHPTNMEIDHLRILLPNSRIPDYSPLTRHHQGMDHPEYRFNMDLPVP
jgi:dihydroneopterin aldolase